MSKLWTEHYRPKTVDGYVFRDASQKEQVAAWLREGMIPHLLFSGAPGTGKTTLAKVLLNELGVDDYDVLEINASRENSVDTIRDKITNFVQTMPFGKFKVALLDECLDENTVVIVLRNEVEQAIAIKDLDPKIDLVKSYNVKKQRVEWKPFDLFDKGTQDTLEIEFETGDVVVCTLDHKWYVEGPDGEPLVVKAKELENYAHILSPTISK